MPQAPTTFRPPGARTRFEQKRQADRFRGSARERGYDAEWDRESKAFLRAHPLCLGCEAVGRVTAAELTDHIVPHQGDRALFRDRANRQPACRWHHDVVKQRLEAMFARGEIGRADLRLDSAVSVRLTRGG